ncbi:TspO/MBR family protein [Mycobacterium sp. 236(2023)]|uniref:TspO/MBR family protein n=1 Tax=Mycobacterium sp. 236(2023) TaxID=3038163 RepID=UPI00241525E8|nr:TspO/MBR family protein [Mycobacterium sp. 236(2023)]MDG4666634.1 tryptophan-rich sensory protein [Mycobacterium sp. 236(2023)]
MRPSTLAKTAAGSFAAAAAGALATRPAVQSSWYSRLKKPGFQPPRQAFPIAWNILYSDIAAVSASTLDTLNDRGDTDAARKYTGALAVNLVLNAGWSWVFFNRRKLGAAALLSGALTVSSADLARRAGSVDPKAGAALALYPAWCGFATALSTRIWQLNR